MGGGFRIAASLLLAGCGLACALQVLLRPGAARGVGERPLRRLHGLLSELE